MANPIFSRSTTFNPAQPAYATARTGYPQQGYQGYQQPGYPQQGYQGYPQHDYQPQSGGNWGTNDTAGRMTIEDVISKSTITLLAMMAVAVATWMLLPGGLALPAMVVSSLVGFVVVFLVARKPTVSPVGVLVYAGIEGVAIGVFSKLFEALYPGIVTQAVLGTFVAAGVTLAAYKYLRIRVTAKFRKIVYLSTFAFAGVMLVNLLLSLFGLNTGLRGFGVLGLVVALLGAGLAVANLITDFDAIEQGIAGGAPSSESWRAALGLTVTMVWLYTEILRILSYFRSN